MRSLIVTSLLVVGLALTAMPAFTQTTSLPAPVAVVRDADGKVVGQVAGFSTGTQDDGNRPMLVLNLGGVPGLFIARPWGLQSPQTGAGRFVYFSGPGCTGDAFIYRTLEAGLEEMSNMSFVVLGPESTAGTYRVFRAIEEPYFTASFNSRQTSGEVCIDQSGSQAGVVNAEELTPNPLEGFHGPTLANPERIWTVIGGDRVQ